jgi:hypothetical protein
MSSVVIAFLATLAPTFGASACGAAATTEQSSSQSGQLLSYREEGGIGGPRPSLAVSKRARATLRLGGCRTSFTLGARLWRRLRAALKSADLGSIAGSYPPPSGSADTITYVIRSGGHEVRISPAPEYEEVLAQLEPLLEVIGKVVAVGKRRLPSSCSSNRAERGGAL